MRAVSTTPSIELIAVQEAVRRSSWSAGYIRSLAQCGKLDSDRSSGAILIDAECLAILLRARAARRRRPRLRLVIDNA
ncbi:hypothetical protein [Ollibium composti]|uniref:Uncharacterized protein n=1 Tax=Ollibium composti TaxID=2675109 RepID=A0ABY2QDB0_9HYPH|nr:hypothetical protein [Mesorhizobium composti]THF59857.1 hypothetical protein E6C48_02065 [Mesorhizobium composti]